MQLGVAILPCSFQPSETKALYFIKRPPRPNILSPSIKCTYKQGPKQGDYARIPTSFRYIVFEMCYSTQLLKFVSRQSQSLKVS